MVNALLATQKKRAKNVFIHRYTFLSIILHRVETGSYNVNFNLLQSTVKYVMVCLTVRFSLKFSKTYLFPE